jgi:protein-L-isoaspartate(D-aspartate) O-methyltransferase
MVREQIAARGICDPALLEAMRTIPREQFVSADLADQAYEDRPLPIAAGQTISQPYIVALMIEAAGVGRGSRVLEVGAGSGYAAAVIGWMAAEVIAVERHFKLAQLARDRMAELGLSNVAIVHGDGTRGWPEGAPYDAIVTAAAGERVPDALIDQLATGGRLVMPIGAVDAPQRLVSLTKEWDGRLTWQELGPVRFVPLIGDDEDG